MPLTGRGGQRSPDMAARMEEGRVRGSLLGPRCTLGGWKPSQEGKKDVLLDRGQVLFYCGRGAVLSEWGPYFPHDIGRISVGEPHCGLVMEKLGLCCADMSIKSAPEGRHCAFQSREQWTPSCGCVCVHVSVLPDISKEEINLEN